MFNAKNSQQQGANYDILERLLGIDRFAEKIFHQFMNRMKSYEHFYQGGSSSSTNDDEIFDFIVVGSGSAGAVIASRLSEVPHWNVLLLEAGRVENSPALVPPLAPLLQFTDYNWPYLMEYQEGIGKGLVGHKMAWPRGRALGGTTVINYMIYTRGNPEDYDRWAAKGNPGWSYQDVLPYFLKSENSSLIDGDPNYHNTKGEWSVTNPYRGPLLNSFLSAGQELGFDIIDYTTPRQIGFSSVKANQVKGRRHSIATAFLQPIKHRKNLHIRTSAHANRILVDPQTRQAYGVDYDYKGHSRKAFSKKEVILSAGTFNSPQLLMLSGIGPAEDLQNLGIPVLQDLAVGKFMQDHLTFVGLIFTVNKNVTVNIQSALATESVRNYLEYGTGPISSLGGVEGLGYVQVLDATTPNFPDVELIFVGGSLNSDYGLGTRRSMRIRDDVYDKLWRPLHDVPAWTIFPMPVHPESIGSMSLRSKNPYDAPLLFGNYFTDAQNKDMRTMIASIRFALKLAQSEGFRKYDSKLYEVPVPGCERHRFNSDAYWECAVRALSVTLHHQVGTCKMGPGSDPSAIVDAELKVHGVSGLRVADCSVIPFAITAHTSAPCAMVGEKGSDLIKGSWKDF
ncbi:hypothetical protein Trydic_g2496 [Trypoxylus dichotomus]